MDAGHERPARCRILGLGLLVELGPQLLEGLHGINLRRAPLPRASRSHGGIQSHDRALLTEWFSAIETEWLSQYSPLFARVDVPGEVLSLPRITGIKEDHMTRIRWACGIALLAMAAAG